MPNNPKVFISYSHQNPNYDDRVLDFADKLRSHGIDANVDFYEESPPEGWPRWMENQIRISDFVLVINSESYYDKCYSANKSKGVSWEVNIVNQSIYDANAENTKFIPVFFDEKDAQYILTTVKPFTYYNVGTKEGYDKLYCRLRGVTQTQKPPLGELKPLPLKERKTKLLFHNLPMPNPHFTGRKDISKSMSDNFQSGERINICQTISGMGGTGKTQWKKLKPLIFLLFGAFILGIIYLLFIAPRLIVTITEPKDKENVPREYMISGNITGDIPDNEYLWVFCEDNTGRFWPMHKPLSPIEGPWHASVIIGDVKSSGCTFQIYVISISADVYNDNYKSFIEHDPFQGMPPSAKVLAHVVVSRE